MDDSGVFSATEPPLLRRLKGVAEQFSPIPASCKVFCTLVSRIRSKDIELEASSRAAADHRMGPDSGETTGDLRGETERLTLHHERIEPAGRQVLSVSIVCRVHRGVGGWC
jgi:hypothetical protein